MSIPKGTILRPVPDDFAEAAKTRTANALREYYRTKETLIRRWMRETGVVPVSIAEARMAWARPRPDDFDPLATTKAIREKYRTSNDVVVRWREEVGVTPAAYRAYFLKEKRDREKAEAAARKAEREAAALPKKAPYRSARLPSPKLGFVPIADQSVAARAASFLIRKGFYANNGKLWNRFGEWRVNGKFIRTAAMIEMAERRGFQDNEWGVAA